MRFALRPRAGAGAYFGAQEKGPPVIPAERGPAAQVTQVRHLQGHYYWAMSGKYKGKYGANNKGFSAL